MIDDGDYRSPPSPLKEENERLRDEVRTLKRLARIQAMKLKVRNLFRPSTWSFEREWTWSVDWTRTWETISSFPNSLVSYTLGIGLLTLILGGAAYTWHTMSTDLRCTSICEGQGLRYSAKEPAWCVCVDAFGTRFRRPKHERPLPVGSPDVHRP